jgi:hypothetical protein
MSESPPTDGQTLALPVIGRPNRPRRADSRVLGGTVVVEENPCIVKLANSWIPMNPGGPPTPDKPGISVVNYEPGDTTSIFLNLLHGEHAAKRPEDLPG